MKNFLKTVLAVVIGLAVVNLIGLWLGITVIAALFSGDEPVMPRKAVLTIDCSQIAFTEQSSEGDFDIVSLMNGEQVQNVGLWDATQAIAIAAQDPAVKFIYIKADGLSGENACVEELRGALVDFRQSGKPVITYIENPSNGSYYLATASDKILMANYPGGMQTLLGFSSQLYFLKDILDKLGVNVQLIRHGKYKSAGEMYIRNSISEANREQYQVLVNSIWRGWAEEMAYARGLSVEQFNALIDNLELDTPMDFLKAGLVDELVSLGGRDQKIADYFGVKSYSDVSSISLQDYASLNVVQNHRGKNGIAVIYADGQIYDGNEKTDVYGDRFAKIIADVRRDSTVKAVVLRVNSPGGAVAGADKIKHELDLLKQDKPVVASYGSYAASGGYWISANCDRIFSDKVTLTGSIGVFSMVPDFSGATKKVGVTFETISSNKHGGMYGLMAPLSSDEKDYFQNQVEDIYDRFTSIVAQGRGMTQNQVDEIAQGRVWAGTDALQIGLVDEIGGLCDAIRYAQFLVDPEVMFDSNQWNFTHLPAPLTTLEQIMELLGSDPEVSALSRSELKTLSKVFPVVSSISKMTPGEAYALMENVIELK